MKIYYSMFLHEVLEKQPKKICMRFWKKITLEAPDEKHIFIKFPGDIFLYNHRGSRGYILKKLYRVRKFLLRF